MGANSAVICGGAGRLFSLGFTGSDNGDALVLYRNCVSIVTVGRTNFAGTITKYKATLANRRIRLVDECTSRIILTCSTSRTNRGTIRGTVHVFGGISIGIHIPGLRCNGSPSRVVGGINSRGFTTVVSNTAGRARCGLLGLEGGFRLGAARNGVSFVGNTMRVLTSSPPVRRSVCVSHLSRRLKVGGRTIGARVDGCLGRVCSHGGERLFEGTMGSSLERGAGLDSSFNTSSGSIGTTSELVFLLVGCPSYTGRLNNFYTGRLPRNCCRGIFGVIIRRVRGKCSGSLVDFSRGLAGSRLNELSNVVTENRPDIRPGGRFSSYLGVVNRRGTTGGRGYAGSVDSSRFEGLFRTRGWILGWRVLCSSRRGGVRGGRVGSATISRTSSGGTTTFGGLIRENGTTKRLATRRVSGLVIRLSLSISRLRGLGSVVSDTGVGVVSSFSSRTLSNVALRISLPGRASTTSAITAGSGTTVSSPIGICLGRVNEIPLLATRRRVRCTVHVTSGSPVTGGELTRTGLHLIMDVTGECINENVRFLSLVRRKGVNLVGTISGFSCAGNFGFSACTA